MYSPGGTVWSLAPTEGSYSLLQERQSLKKLSYFYHMDPASTQWEREGVGSGGSGNVGRLPISYVKL